MPRLGSHVRASKLPIINPDGLKIVQISGQHAFSGAQLVAAESWIALPSLAPQVLIGSAADLRRLVERLDLGTIELNSVDHAVFVLTGIGDKPLPDVFRVVLWQRFGVPVYELYVGTTGTLLAYECEAQDGWHVHPEARFRMRNGQLAVEVPSGLLVATGLLHRFSSDKCACGRSAELLKACASERTHTQKAELAAIA